MFAGLRIASKLFIGFGVLLLLIAISGTVSGISGIQSKESLSEVSRLKSQEVLDQRVEKRFMEARVNLWMALATGQTAKFDAADDAFKIGNEKFEELQHNTIDPGRKAQVAKLGDLIVKYRAVTAKFRTFGGKNASLDNPDVVKTTSEAIQIAKEVADAGEALNHSFQAASDAGQKSAFAFADFVVRLTVGLGILSLVIGAALALSITRSIRLPVVGLTRVMNSLAGGDLTAAVPNADQQNEIGEMARAVQVFKDNGLKLKASEAEAARQRQAAERERAANDAVRAEIQKQQELVVASLASGLELLSKGDLTNRLDQTFSKEYEKLRTDFNVTANSLQDALRTIAVATDGINTGSDQIAAASDDLSKRTEQQAASLEETAAALNLITATVKSMADGSKEAAKIVTVTRDAAEASGRIVTQAVGAMSKIQESSQKITNIIGVIDEIAFQTNLLALNAGVEAARAGDAGRGFAVVASEVRALAQRSAEAAKEIKALISDSTLQVEGGVVLVDQTGTALKGIIGRVAEIDALVHKISASSQEQATGLAEINTAVVQMDQAVQQNAAMVEESTAAAHSLKSETQDLSAMVGRFQIGRFEATKPANREPSAKKAQFSAGRQSAAQKDWAEF